MEIGIGIAVVVAFAGFIYWRASQKKASGTLVGGGSGGGDNPKNNLK